MMLSRLVQAVVIGVIVTLVCLLVGALMGTLTVSWAATIGAWLKSYGGVLGLLAALWHFFGGTAWFRTKT